MLFYLYYIIYTRLKLNSDKIEWLNLNKTSFATKIACFALEGLLMKQASRWADGWIETACLV